MTDYQTKLYDAIKYAVDRAFEELGVEGFKKTSLFLSNKVPITT